VESANTRPCPPVAKRHPHSLTTKTPRRKMKIRKAVLPVAGTHPWLPATKAMRRRCDHRRQQLISMFVDEAREARHRAFSVVTGRKQGSHADHFGPQFRSM